MIASMLFGSDANALLGFGGYPVYPNDVRALSQQEFANWQLSTAQATRQALGNAYGNLAYRNCLWPAPERKPLNERFADFKLRLAAAIAKRRGLA